MNFDALARFVSIITITVCFALGPQAIDVHPNRSEVVELVALDDGTALVTQRGDAASFISRIRADGTRLQIEPVPGTVLSDSLGASSRGSAVLYMRENELGIATYAPDGTCRWTHVLSRERDAFSGRARPVLAGDVVIASWIASDLHVTGLSSADGAIRWDRTHDIDGVFDIEPDFQPILRTSQGEFAIDPRTGDLAPHSVCPSSPDGSRVVACGRYGSSLALLIQERGGTTIALLERDGRMKDTQQLPHVRPVGYEVTGGVPPERIAFSGALPRYVPLVAAAGNQSQPILVDMETLEVVARGEPGYQVEVLRDGDIAYVLSDRSALSVFMPETHALVPVARILQTLDVTQVGGGYIWTFDVGTSDLDAPPITATPALPRRV